MTININELIAKFNKCDFGVTTPPKTPTTSFSIKQLVKLFEAGTIHDNTDHNKPPYHIANAFNHMHIDYNQTPRVGQFEKTSSSQELQVFPDLLCDGIKPDANQTAPVTLGHQKTEGGQFVQQRILEYENMGCEESGKRVEWAPVKSSGLMEELIAIFETDGTCGTTGEGHSKNDDNIKHSIAHGNPAPVDGEHFEKVSNTLVDTFPDAHPICDDSIMLAGMMSVNRNDTFEDVSEIQPNPVQPPQSLLDNQGISKTSLRLAEQELTPTVTADTQGSQVRKKKYLTRYLMKIAGTSARTTSKKTEKTSEHVHDKAGETMKNTDIGKETKKRKRSLFTSYLAVCFGFQKKKSSPKIKQVPVTTPTRNNIHTSNIMIPVPPAKYGESVGDIQVTITAALCK